MDKLTRIIIMFSIAIAVLIAIMSATMYRLGFIAGEESAFEKFQSDECHIEKISNDVICIKYVGGE